MKEHGCYCSEMTGKAQGPMVIGMGKRTLDTVRCPQCSGIIENVQVDEDSIQNAKRVPVIIPAKCSKGHSVVIFVDRNFTIRDVEATGEAVQGDDDKGSVDKAQSWMDSF